MAARGSLSFCRALCYCLAAGVLFTTFSSSVSAAPENSDGVYGRLAPDLAIEPSVGVELSRGQLLPELGIGAYYLSTLGFRLHHADAAGTMTPDRRVTSIDLELRPLFLARWSQALEKGPAILDLTLDSWVLGLGAFWDYEASPSVLRRGTVLFTGFGLPLTTGSSGPWLRAIAGLRIAEAPHFGKTTDSVGALYLAWNLPIGTLFPNDDH